MFPYNLFILKLVQAFSTDFMALLNVQLCTPQQNRIEHEEKNRVFVLLDLANSSVFCERVGLLFVFSLKNNNGTRKVAYS